MGCCQSCSLFLKTSIFFFFHTLNFPIITNLLQPSPPFIFASTPINYYFFPRPPQKKGDPLNTEIISKINEEKLIFKPEPPKIIKAESTNRTFDPTKTPLKADNFALNSKTFANNDKDQNDYKILRCKSSVKAQESIDISQLKLESKVENALLLYNSKSPGLNSPEKNEELLSHQTSYLGQISIGKAEVQKLLTLKDHSIIISPDQPLIEEKKEDEEKLDIQVKKMTTLISEKEHALNEKSKKKFNPEIFIQLKTGTFLTHYKIGQVLGEGFSS